MAIGLNSPDKGRPLQRDPLPQTADILLTQHTLPALDAKPTTPPSTLRPGPVKTAPRIGAFERLYDPATWAERPGAIAAAARLFFAVCPNERSAWLPASGASFTTRILVAHGISLVSNSRVLLPAATFAIGVAVSWSVAYPLLRLQDKRECRNEDGSFDSERYQAGKMRRFLFLPKQEAGAACCFGLCSAAVMALSLEWPILFGAAGGAAISLGTFALQGFLVNHYEKIFAKLANFVKRKPDQ